MTIRNCKRFAVAAGYVCTKFYLSFSLTGSQSSDWFSFYFCFFCICFQRILRYTDSLWYLLRTGYYISFTIWGLFLCPNSVPYQRNYWWTMAADMQKKCNSTNKILQKSLPIPWEDAAEDTGSGHRIFSNRIAVTATVLHKHECLIWKEQRKKKYNGASVS